MFTGHSQAISHVTPFTLNTEDPVVGSWCLSRGKGMKTGRPGVQAEGSPRLGSMRRGGNAPSPTLARLPGSLLTCTHTEKKQKKRQKGKPFLQHFPDSLNERKGCLWG